MFFKKKSAPEPTHLQKVIDDLLTKLETTPLASNEHAHITDQIAKLYKLQETDKPDFISKDALLAAGVTLAVALMVIFAERSGVITSKGFAFIGRKFL